MPRRTVPQQLDALRPTLRFAAHAHRWFLGAAALGVAAAVLLWHPVPLMIAAFLALVGLSERRAGPNIVAAITAYDADPPTIGEVEVSISSGDSSDRYQARVRSPGHPAWSFDFIPQGWSPQQRSYAARIWRAGREGRPVLVVVDEGILIPRGDPTATEPV